MVIGSVALDPSTPYIVYSFELGGKVFYIGICQEHSTRHTHRWSFVKNLLRHEESGTLTPGKQAELRRKSNSVLSELIKAGAEPHRTNIIWRGNGRVNAEVAEAKIIQEYLSSGCVLANIQGLGSQFTVAQVLSYLGIGPAGA